MERQLRYMVGVWLLISALMMPATADAQKSYLKDITFGQTEAAREGDHITVTSLITLDRLRLNSQDLIILTPKITSLEGDHECLLPPVFVAGKTRGVVLERESRFDNERPYMTLKPQSITTRRDHSRQSVTYAAQVPYELWMSAASLSMEEWVVGCAACEKSHTSMPLLDRIISEPYRPTYKTLYIVPQAEAVKSREDRYVATVNFRVGKDNLEYDYLNNSEVLGEMQGKVAKVVRNKDLTVSDIQVIGYSSPEAPSDYNKALSERRAKAIADFLVLKFDLPRAKMKVSGYGEDWDGVRAEIAASNLADKDEVLKIIDGTPDVDARDVRLKKLSGGATYGTMVETIYPHIRRTEYALSYVVRGFDLGEAKQVFRENPKLLSLNEMYLVAKSYPAGSAEFKEVFDVATRLYPKEPVAIINAAATDIEGGNYQAAIQRLLRIQDNPQAWNNLAIAYALTGDYEQAKVYFEKAVAAHDETAVLNHQEFQKSLADMVPE